MARGKPEVEWDELYASTEFRELFRYRKDKVERIYNLRVEKRGASVWVNEESRASTKTIEKKHFKTPDGATKWLQEQERGLKAVGWMAP